MQRWNRDCVSCAVCALLAWDPFLPKLATNTFSFFLSATPPSSTLTNIPCHPHPQPSSSLFITHGACARIQVLQRRCLDDAKHTKEQAKESESLHSAVEATCQGCPSLFSGGWKKLCSKMKNSEHTNVHECHDGPVLGGCHSIPSSLHFLVVL